MQPPNTFTQAFRNKFFERNKKTDGPCGTSVFQFLVTRIASVDLVAGQLNWGWQRWQEAGWSCRGVLTCNLRDVVACGSHRPSPSWRAERNVGFVNSNRSGLETQ